MPRTVRAGLAGHVLPAWLRGAAGLPEGAAVESLEAEVDGPRLERLGRRLELYFFRLLDSNRAAVRCVRVLDRPWPPALDPGLIRWPPNARRLRDAGIAADAASLSRLTYGDLFAVPRVGVRAVVAFAAAAEAALDRAYAGTEVPRELVALERHVARAAWAARLDADPRLAGVLPPGARVSSKGSLWRLPEVCELVALIDRAPLDVALRDYVAALTEADGERLEAVLGRLGLDGRPPRSLPKTVNRSGLTTERIRQLQLRALGRRPAQPVYMPALDRALAHLAGIAPCTVEEGAASLRASGIASIPFHPASVLAAAEFCGASAAFVLGPAREAGLVLTEPASTWAPKLVRLARQRARRFGAASISALASSTGDLPREEARRLVTTLLGARFLDDDWFWLPQLRSRVVALTLRVLAVSDPLEVAALHAGVSRAYPRREAQLVPPRAVLAALYRAHPTFGVDAGGRVRALGPVDCGSYLGKNDRLFVEAFADAGVLDTASFRDACVGRGMTPETFALCKTYSVVLDHPAADVWCLRSTSPWRDTRSRRRASSR